MVWTNFLKMKNFVGKIKFGWVVLGKKTNFV